MIIDMSIKKYLSHLDDLTGKEVLVTGGTSGIGLSIVKHLLNKNADVVILARNLKKAEDVRSKLLEIYKDSHISLIKYDQNDDISVKEAAKEIINNHPSFYALILNAGIMQSKKSMTLTDGYPTTIKTNYVGLALFLEELLPHLEAHKRIIFQGSFVAGWRVKRKKFTTLKEEKLSMWQRYIISKSGVEALYYHYANSDLPFDFYLVEPGLVDTDIVRDFPRPIRVLGKLFMKTVSHSADKAALTALLAVMEKTPRGSYIVPRGFLTYMGYPKIKIFPKKRERKYLVEML